MWGRKKKPEKYFHPFLSFNLFLFLFFIHSQKKLCRRRGRRKRRDVWEGVEGGNIKYTERLLVSNKIRFRNHVDTFHMYTGLFYDLSSAVFCFTSIKLQNMCVYLLVPFLLPLFSQHRLLFLAFFLPKHRVLMYIYTFIRVLRRQTSHII